MEESKLATIKDQVVMLKKEDTIIRELTETELGAFSNLLDSKDRLGAKALEIKKEADKQMDDLHKQNTKDHESFWGLFDAEESGEGGLGVRFNGEKYLLVQPPAKTAQKIDTLEEEVEEYMHVLRKDIVRILSDDTLTNKELNDAISGIAERLKEGDCIGTGIRQLPGLPECCAIAITCNGLTIKFGNDKVIIPYESNEVFIIPILKTILFPKLKKYLDNK